MKKLLFFTLPPILGCIVFFTTMFILSKTDKGKGALQVTASPKAEVYLDGKSLGKTPFCKCDLPDMLPVGDHTVKLVPEDTTLQPFEQQIPINKSVITVVDISFGESTSGSIISLNPLPEKEETQIFATSFPTGAKTFLDKSEKGETPILIKDVTDSDHDILFEKDGYQKKVLHVHTVKGYKLSTVAFLGIKSDINPFLSLTPAMAASGSPTPPIANVSGTPAPTAKLSVSPTRATDGKPQVLILDTPTGFLRVREKANGYSPVITNVDPGQTFPLPDEANGWYQITLPDGTKGWVSGQYSKKQ